MGVEYVSAADLARAWGVSARYVQRLMSQGRIPGARLSQRRWMAPADARKPKGGRSGGRYLLFGLLSAAVPMPGGDPDAARGFLSDEGQRAQYAAEVAYLRGDFAAVKAYWAGLARDAPTWPAAACVAIAAAMSTGDYPLFAGIRASAKALAERASDPGDALAASLPEALAAVSMSAPQMAPDWLKRGDFSAFPMDARPFCVFLRVKFLQNARAHREMLASAQTALALLRRPGGVTLAETYLVALSACALYALDRPEETRSALDEAVALCAKSGFVAPLGECATAVGGLMQAALKKAPPAFESRVLALVQGTLRNWLYFHNEFTQDNLSLILTAREYQLAVLLKEGKTYRQAAGQLRLSPGRVKNLVSILYEKLGIARRSEIAKYVN